MMHDWLASGGLMTEQCRVRGELPFIQLGLTAADMRAKDNNTLFIAVWRGHVPVVRFLMKEEGLTADGRRAPRRLPGLMDGRDDMARYLVEIAGVEATPEYASLLATAARR
jgi:hypothetical protein